MTEDRYIPGVPCWVDTTQPDPAAAIEFYSSLFGWEFEDVMPADAPGRYAIARLGGGDVAAVGSSPPGAPPRADWRTYVWVESADATASKVVDAGGTVVVAPFDVGDLGRTAAFTDTEGAAFSVWQPGRHRGAQVVNVPGSLNFNDLHTRDRRAAEAFYGAVFGWTTLEMGGGHAMWTLAAYGDLLERRTPGTRANMAEMGAPAGFEDVVASLEPIAEDRADAAPHWRTTFAVDDADAVAERAAQLGARVEVAPLDAPWVRMTVIADPQGATFVASQFKPQNRDLPAEAGAATAA